MRLQYQLRVVEAPWEGLEEDEEDPTTDEQVEQYAQAVREAAVPEMRYLAALAVNDGLCKPTGEIEYRATCNRQVIDTPIDEMGDRIVMVVVTGQLSRLWLKPPWADVG